MAITVLPPRNVQLVAPPPIKRYGFAAITFHLRDHTKWPTVSTTGLSAEAKERFERLERGIKTYLDSGGKLAQALEEARCTKEVFYEQLWRCLQPIDALGTIAGWAGIIAHLRLKTYTRVNEGKGNAGKFEQWLAANPEWRKTLHTLIHKGAGGTKIAAKLPTLRGVATAFIRKIMAAIPVGTYPHIATSTKPFCARRSIERYIKSYVELNLKTTKVWFGDKVAARQHLGTGHESFLLEAGPFDMVGCDAHTIDCIGILIVEGPAGPQRIPVTRLKLVVLICQRTRCVLGYSVCIQPQVSSQHVEQAYLMCTTKWQPKELTLGEVQYNKTAGFPCGSIEGIVEINFAGLQLDNAAQHFAKGIQLRLRHSIGCMVAWGGVGHWWRNAVVERFFGVLEQRGFKRLPSTMGSGTQDPQRGDPVLEAVGCGIEVHELLQLLDVLLANYNGKSSKSLGGRSPLETVRDSLNQHHLRWIPRLRPPYGATTLRPGIEIVDGVINGYLSSRVPPYVELDGTRYTNPELAKRYDLIGRKVFLHVGEDMRTIEAFLDDGTPLGELRCTHRGWSVAPHSRDTRKAINALIAARELPSGDDRDPIADYLDYLASKAGESASTKGKPKVSAAASDAADAQRKATSNPPPSPSPKPAPAPAPRVPAAAANAPAFENRRRLVGVSLPQQWR
ncbi:hypothetical protein [Roseateles asaccharophilus]|uniref:Integrase catalytic domain-containing protein n=1 Tax=Roseateles asaccharophilus TaxID=582607 RepID=A0ABU2AAV9_9BURK|nr:hypothetical protein [Roseateles asaccharophilus]MDR7334334.1 hypothetical protein [Roseateles asaccharophilus]